jgi:hypothetical protein
MQRPIVAFSDLESARTFHAALAGVFRQHPGGCEDELALEKIKVLCSHAAGVVEDAYCWEMLGIINGYAADLFSDHKHLKWNQGEVPGAQFLKELICGGLAALGNRLDELEPLIEGQRIQVPDIGNYH